MGWCLTIIIILIVLGVIVTLLGSGSGLAIYLLILGIGAAILGWIALIGAIVLYVMVNAFGIWEWSWWNALILGLCITIIASVFKPTIVKKVVQEPMRRVRTVEFTKRGHKVVDTTYEEVEK
jgi:hypothetical protein